MTTEYEFHEAADMFPMMNKRQFEALKADIKKNGLLEPIRLHEGKIIDGRCRYKACMELGITPATQELPVRWHGKLVDFLISCNLQRRSLTSSQRAMIAVESGLLDMFTKEAKERQRAAGRKYGRGRK